MDKMISENVNGENSVDSVHSVEKPLPNSRKIYASGEIHPGVRVPFREITLAPTKSMNGEIEINEPVRVYDTSGPWGDPSVTPDPVQGHPPVIRSRSFGMLARESSRPRWNSSPSEKTLDAKRVHQTSNIKHRT